MRTLGLDVGDRRIGVAISDPDGRIALPLRVIDQRSEDATRLLSVLIKDEQVEHVVIGLPLSMSGDRGPQADKAELFAGQLQAAVATPVTLLDERLSSVEADRRMHDLGMKGKNVKANRDAVAASIILQSYLDSRNAPPLPPIE